MLSSAAGIARVGHQNSAPLVLIPGGFAQVINTNDQTRGVRGIDTPGKNLVWSDSHNLGNVEVVIQHVDKVASNFDIQVISELLGDIHLV